jgi:hypothetical protein
MRFFVMIYPTCGALRIVLTEIRSIFETVLNSMNRHCWPYIVGLFLVFSCKKSPETGFEGVVLSGKGSCDVTYEEGYGREYDKYDGTVYFLPYSIVQEIPIKSAENLRSGGLAFKSKDGNVNAELSPGIYVLMLEDYYSPESDKVIRIIENEVVRENISFWECE